ncbi:MAG: hypothetical protein AAGF94_15455, partial [Pseudomonadota bacterium]
ATTVFDSGLPTTINTAINDDVVIKNSSSGDATAVTLKNGAAITAQGLNAAGVTVEDTSTLSIEGGKITGSSALSGGPGIVLDGMTRLTMGEGVVQAVGAFPGISAFSALTVSISGGSISGGSGPTTGFLDDRNGLSMFSGILAISGGTFTGGDVTNAANQGGSGLLIDGGTTSAQIAGGIFTGGEDELGGGFGLALIGSEVEVLGGTFSAGNSSGDNRLSVSVSSAAILNLKGGMFDGDFAVEFDGVLNVFGEDLTFQNGMLKGHLQSGEEISVSVGLVQGGQVNLINSGFGAVLPPQIPLPPALPLLAAGLGALALIQRRSA